jgi:hypothetical protein
MATTRTDEKKVDSYRQGVEIGDYEQVFASTLPRILSNSSPRMVVNGRLKEFGPFDESTSQPINRNNLNGSWSGSSTVISHFMEVRDLGVPRSSDPAGAFLEMSDFNASSYLQDTGERMYPIVLENTSYEDPGRLDGAIEPLPVRTSISDNVTVGFNNGRGVHGETGVTVTDRFGRGHSIEQVVYFGGRIERVEPYLETGDDLNTLVNVPIFHTPIDEPIGFTDSSDIDETLKKIVDSDIVGALRKNSGYTFPGLSRNYKSAAAGRDIIGGDTNGTDSIAFADRRNY